MAVPLPWRGATFRLGVIVALVTAAADQAVKFWLLYGFDLPGRGRVALAPFLDLVLAWNTGISYGLFQQAGPLGQWALFALKVVAVVLLALWLARTGSRLSGVALGLIIGGAIGNAVDRLDSRSSNGFRAFSSHRRDLELSVVRLQPRRCSNRCGSCRSAV